MIGLCVDYTPSMCRVCIAEYVRRKCANSLITHHMMTHHRAGVWSYAIFTSTCITTWTHSHVNQTLFGHIQCPPNGPPSMYTNSFRSIVFSARMYWTSPGRRQSFIGAGIECPLFRAREYRILRCVCRWLHDAFIVCIAVPVTQQSINDRSQYTFSSASVANIKRNTCIPHSYEWKPKDFRTFSALSVCQLNATEWADNIALEAKISISIFPFSELLLLLIHFKSIYFFSTLCSFLVSALVTNRTLGLATPCTRTQCTDFHLA